MVLLLRKLYLYFTKDPEAVNNRGGGVIAICQGGVRTPYPPMSS